MSAVAVETSDLYSAFVWLALRLFAGGVELVATSPRSFVNGSYFRPFRQILSHELAFRRIHVYDARDTTFADDGVPQENMIFHGVRGDDPGAVGSTLESSARNARSPDRRNRRASATGPARRGCSSVPNASWNSVSLSPHTRKATFNPISVTPMHPKYSRNIANLRWTLKDMQKIKV